MSVNLIYPTARHHDIPNTQISAAASYEPQDMTYYQSGKFDAFILLPTFLDPVRKRPTKKKSIERNSLIEIEKRNNTSTSMLHIIGNMSHKWHGT